MVRSSGVSDPEAAFDLLVADFSERYGAELRIRSQTGGPPVAAKGHFREG
jgi:hypothetical protein